DRDAGARRHRRERRDARDDLERDPRSVERERLLAATAEDERVAALEADDLEALAAEPDQQVVQLLLADAGARDPERVLGRLVDELGRDERVAGADELEALRRDQARVARARADEIDAQLSRSRTSRSK